MNERELIHERQIGNVLIQTYITQEKIPPEDIFKVRKDVEDIHSGKSAYFTATVEVYFGLSVGTNRLGCCAYDSHEDFMGSGYWRDMVREAARNCRRTILHQQKAANYWAARLRQS